MHPDLAAQAADLYRAEREREAHEERRARAARNGGHRNGTQERRRTRPTDGAEERGGTGETAHAHVHAA